MRLSGGALDHLAIPHEILSLFSWSDQEMNFFSDDQSYRYSNKIFKGAAMGFEPMITSRLNALIMVDPENYDIPTVRLWAGCSASELRVHKYWVVIETKRKSNNVAPASKLRIERNPIFLAEKWCRLTSTL